MRADGDAAHRKHNLLACPSMSIRQASPSSAMVPDFVRAKTGVAVVLCR